MTKNIISYHGNAIVYTHHKQYKMNVKHLKIRCISALQRIVSGFKFCTILLKDPTHRRSRLLP